MNTSLLEKLERVHLQWFADAEEVVVEDENVEEDEEDFKIYIEGQDDIPEEEPEEEGPSKEELLSQLTRLQEQQAAATNQLGDRQTLEKGFQDLASVLTNQQQQQPTTAQPTETWDQVKKRLASDFYNDPMAAIEEALKFAIQTEVAPAFHQTQELLSKTAMTTSRQIAETNPTNKLILEKYRDEVDSAVRSLPPTPDVYEKACQQVGMNHFTDIMQEQVQAMIQEQASGTAAPKKALPKSNVMPTGVATRGVAKTSKPKVLTKQQKALADAAGITYEAAYRYFNEQ